MQACQNHARSSIAADAMEQLSSFVEERRTTAHESQTDLEAFERELDRRMAAVKREILAEELARHDVDTPAVVVEGVLHRRVLRCAETYMSAAGPVRVERTLYRASGQSETICPLELRVGIIAGRFGARQEFCVWTKLSSSSKRRSNMALS